MSKSHHIKMGHLYILVAVACLYKVHATLVDENLEMERFAVAESKSGRSSYPPYKNYKENLASPTAVRPTPSNVVYGKMKPPRPTPQQAYISPSIKGKPIVGKFKPSQEDIAFDTEAINSYGQTYKPTAQETAALQKYMQRYATQVFNAQKHASQLSENQKHVISSDPYKKYIPPSGQKFKFTPVFNPEVLKQSAGERLKDYDTVEINTEKYQSQFHVMQQQLSVQPPSFPKKAYSLDSALQPSDYKFSSQDSHLAQQLFEEPEKNTWGLEQFQYGMMSHEKPSDLSKITGYKIPAMSSISLGHSVETKEEEEKGHEEHHEPEPHYPHHEPKYEYMYQVHDPEKHNNFGHSEARKGKNTWGRYYVQLPDGRLETVKYWVDKNGYHAEVDFKGEAKHPSHDEYHHQQPKQEEHKAPEHAPEPTSAPEPKSFPGFSEHSGLSGHSQSSFTFADALTMDEYPY